MMFARMPSRAPAPDELASDATPTAVAPRSASAAAASSVIPATLPRVPKPRAVALPSPAPIAMAGAELARLPMNAMGLSAMALTLPTKPSALLMASCWRTSSGLNSLSNSLSCETRSRALSRIAMLARAATLFVAFAWAVASAVAASSWANSCSTWLGAPPNLSDVNRSTNAAPPASMARVLATGAAAVSARPAMVCMAPLPASDRPVSA